jgi:hypothetical protein
MLGQIMRQVLIGAAIVAAVLLGWLAWDGWIYLQRGYSLGVSMEGQAASVFHIDFPMWRAATHALLCIAAMAAIVAYISGHRRAPTIAWLTFAATLAVGIYDLVQYGTIGSPTSIWTLFVLLLFSLLTRFRPLPSKGTA